MTASADESSKIVGDLIPHPTPAAMFPSQDRNAADFPPLFICSAYGRSISRPPHLAVFPFPLTIHKSNFIKLTGWNVCQADRLGVHDSHSHHALSAEVWFSLCLIWKGFFFLFVSPTCCNYRNPQFRTGNNMFFFCFSVFDLFCVYLQNLMNVEILLPLLPLRLSVSPEIWILHAMKMLTMWKKDSGGSYAVTEFCWITLNINAMNQISSSLA